MANSVTVKDIARGAAVSTVTVSRVFNNHHSVTEETRQRVLKVASEMGYFTASISSTPNRYLSRTLKEIGFLLCMNVENNTVVTDPFWSAILHGAENEAQKYNIRLTYGVKNRLIEQPQLLLNNIYDMRIGGLVLVGPTEPEIVKLIQTTSLPIVLVDNYVPDSGTDAVLSNSFEGAKKAVEYLITMGHQNIGFIGGPLNLEKPLVNRVYSIQQRAEGYRKALEEANIPFNRVLFETTDFTPDSIYAACGRLLNSGSDFSALFCANDVIAAWAIKALREAGRRVPEEISIVGFDDVELAEHLTPTLTTVRVSKEAMGGMAVKALVARVAEPQAVNTITTLQVKLIKRDSVIKHSS